MCCMACKLRGAQRWSFGRKISNYVKESPTASISEGKASSCTQKPVQSNPCKSWLHRSASHLRECTAARNLLQGRTFHFHIITCGWGHNILLSNLLLLMYGHCLALEDAHATFHTMLRRNLLSWNFMLSIYVQHGQDMTTLKLFQLMQLQGVMPNKITFIIMLSACVNQATPLIAGKHMHALIIEGGLAFDVFAGTAIITMYGKSGLLKEAHKAFDLIPERNVVSWNAMISACSQHRHGAKAMHFFQQMMLEGFLPTRVTFVSLLDASTNLGEGKQMHTLLQANGFQSDIVIENALVNLYGKHGTLEDAQRTFDNIRNPNLVSYNAMIAACAHNGMTDAAYQLFEQMYVQSLIPNSITFIAMLSMCTLLGALEKGKQMHACITNSGLELDIVLRTALINMYGKCGHVLASREEFDEMLHPNSTSWNTMFATYAQHGQGEETLSLFYEMLLKGTMPDEVTFVSLLSACTHAGLVDEGWQYFTSMKLDFGIKASLEHYHCMIDLLGRAGRLEEMEVLLKAMPFEATGTSWMTLLGACRTHSDVQRGTQAAENVSTHEPENAAPFLMLSNICSVVEDYNHTRAYLSSFSLHSL